MDILFHSQEGNDWFNFLSQLITSTIGAAIGAFATWIVFVLTIENNFEVERRKSDQDRQAKTIRREIEKETEENRKISYENDKLKYLAESLNSIVFAVNQQIVSLNITLFSFYENSIEMPDLDVILNYALEGLIDKSNYEDYYHAFRNRNPDH